jgi:hypothetical protein
LLPLSRLLGLKEIQHCGIQFGLYCNGNGRGLLALFPYESKPEKLHVAVEIFQLFCSIAENCVLSVSYRLIGFLGRGNCRALKLLPPHYPCKSEPELPYLAVGIFQVSCFSAEKRVYPISCIISFHMTFEHVTFRPPQWKKYRK